MRLPSGLVEEWAREPAWLDALPRLSAECAEAWGLELEEPIDTRNSLVVPAGDAVLKLNAPPHFEADEEPDALELWAGRGAVRLLARDDSRRAFLVERCVPGDQLWGAGVDETTVVTALLPRLELRPTHPHPFRLLADEAERWADEIPLAYEQAGKPFERSLLDVAVDVYRTADRAASYLVNQDLHGGNILRAEREPWLVIDPKPLVGERELDAVALLRNAADGENTGSQIAAWLDALRDAGLDRERACAWGVAHALAWGWDHRGEWSARQVEFARRILAA